MTIQKTRILMRKGNEYTVSKTQGDAIREQIANSGGSCFINITSLGTTINSADISEMINELEEVAQTENLLGVGELTPEQKKKRLEIIKKTRIGLEKKGIISKKK